MTLRHWHQLCVGRQRASTSYPFICTSRMSRRSAKALANRSVEDDGASSTLSAPMCSMMARLLQGPAASTCQAMSGTGSSAAVIWARQSCTSCWQFLGSSAQTTTTSTCAARSALVTRNGSASSATLAQALRSSAARAARRTGSGSTRRMSGDDGSASAPGEE
jgi:hypothetical protein